MTVQPGNMRREARLWRQPGPVHHDRLSIQSESGGNSSRAILGSGKNLIEAISEVVGISGDGAHQSAALELIGGSLEHCVFCLAQRDSTRRTVATYTPMKSWSDVAVINGSATFGLSVEGGLLVHCHAWFSDQAGNIGGGHLDPGNCIIGAKGLVVRLTPFNQVRLQQTPDSETNHSVFMAVQEAGRYQ